MQLSVLVELVKDNGYRAITAEPWAASAEGLTREEALEKLKAQVEARLRAGAEIVTLQVGSEPHPWMPYAGMYKNDADFEDVLKIIAENRRQMEDDPGIP